MNIKSDFKLKNTHNVLVCHQNLCDSNFDKNKTVLIKSEYLFR